ncbi:MAG: alpha/beta hydrolase [Deltaproteobacteria bacterium]|jgi:pimeloyl-ACP methyl ester carboxylesterase|nr:alpha/beta hydrolase [Deltaproteobacteria bacterium]
MALRLLDGIRDWPLALLALLALVAFLSGCAATGPAELWSKNVVRSGPSGFQAQDFSTPPFHLAGLLKVQSPGDDLVVYLEGDGRGVSRGRVTQDPTPREAMTLELALQDPAPRVLYLARIGQYMPAYATKANSPYWSHARLAPEAVEAASEAIDQAKLKASARHVHLVGFSGGGGLAILLAERRGDVLSVVTVAGLLDTDWWVRQRKYLPLSLSLNPADKSGDIVGLPQLHLYGTDDPLIPPEMSMEYASRHPFRKLSRVGVPARHDKGWTERWKALLSQYVLPFRGEASASP